MGFMKLYWWFLTLIWAIIGIYLIYYDIKMGKRTLHSGIGLGMTLPLIYMIIMMLSNENLWRKIK